MFQLTKSSLQKLITQKERKKNSVPIFYTLFSMQERLTNLFSIGKCFIVIDFQINYSWRLCIIRSMERMMVGVLLRLAHC